MVTVATLTLTSRPSRIIWTTVHSPSILSGFGASIGSGAATNDARASAAMRFMVCLRMRWLLLHALQHHQTSPAIGVRLELLRAVGALQSVADGELPFLDLVDGLHGPSRAILPRHE